ncbi:hypothetical protein BAU15_05595 [Enterococcus sp. JM4C]|uniref:helix-turn-helix domain-containing protein n=1 Tax=Candidatus Enterococcus huntleyi TaxID=1857217 RepID=UPI00137B5172|nr:helix-turn-helix transcriptional regulator [Enterococcus sp. JM4C]KAF1295223.1 hypothetical protein BAU15_05595 [Enterococcus sp. JM4C]
MDIGSKLKAERTRRGLTQEYVATKMSVSRSTVSSWELGRTYPDLDSLVKLSDFYEISLDNLLREDKVMVKKMDKDLRRGRLSLKAIPIVIVILVGILFFANKNFHSNTRVPIPLASISRVSMVPEELSKQTEIGLEVSEMDQTSYSGYSESIQDEVLYITLWKSSASSSNSKAFKINLKLNDFSADEISSVKKVVLVSDILGDEKNLSDYDNKVIWE